MTKLQEKINVGPLFETLSSQMGPSGWWPANSKWEIAVGAILVQNTSWQNADRALQQVRQVTGLLPERLANLTQIELELLVRPSGFYHNKAKAIMSIFSWFKDYQFNLQAINKIYCQQVKLRQQLLSLPGVGPETADVFLVYLFERPVFIADHYAQRLCQYCGLSDATTYQKLARQVCLPEGFTAAQAQDFHGLIDEFGKQFFSKPITVQASFLADFRLVDQ